MLATGPADYAPPHDTAPLANIAGRLDAHLSRYVRGASVADVREALLRGQVVHLPEADAPACVVAYKRGVLFVCGAEYVIDDA